jgi:hypothetical protein
MSAYLTKTFAAPGDDDDRDSAREFGFDWSACFLTKTDAAPGDDDDYDGAAQAWQPWPKF